MPPTRTDLDSAGHHWLSLSQEAGAYRITLGHVATDLRSVLHDAFRRHLVFLPLGPGSGTDGEAALLAPALQRLAHDADTLAIPRGASSLEIRLGRERSFRIALFALGAEAAQVGPNYILSPFETRYLADNGHPHAVPDDAIGPGPVLGTDLHTHFAGCVSARDLVDIGIQQDVRFPVALLAELGIRVDGKTEVALSSLPPEIRAVLEARLAIPLDRPATFFEMEQIYRWRSPITKHPATFVPLLQRIALDYRRMGVRYVELSLSNVLEAGSLRALHAALPAVEEETGVTLRFLAALSRHNDPEWDLDCIARIAELGKSRYLVGVDFMGHETNSTRAFARQIRTIAEWATRARKGFVIRVHAGENAAYPENVRIAVESSAGCDVALRIGHGLHGGGERTLRLLEAHRVIVEFNLNSNYALNNLQSAGGAPIRTYLERGIAVVLGTDGYGLYQTTPAFEVQAARLVGLTAPDFARIRAVEEQYVAFRHAMDDGVTSDPRSYQTPDDPPPHHFTPAVVERKRRARADRDTALTALLAERGIPLLGKDALAAALRGRRCLSFSGAWAKSWEAISPPQQAIVRREVGRLLDALAPSETVLVTGGTRFGVENVVQECARLRGFTTLATLVWETPPESLTPGAFSLACIVGERLYDKAAGLYRLMRDTGGLCLFIGGGAIVSDEIQTAGNLRAHYLLMEGPEGASSLHAREQPDRSFRTADDVLRALSATPPWTSTADPYWHLGENPTVDIVLTRNHPTRGVLEILLIRRDEDSAAEPGKWALPGGFVRTDAPRGTAFRPGPETERQAAIRELREEAGLDVSSLSTSLLHVGDYAGGGRDPRDTPEAWSRTTVFSLHLDSLLASSPIAGSDDACEAAWIEVDRLPPRLAFDHARIIADGLKKR